MHSQTTQHAEVHALKCPDPLAWKNDGDVKSAGDSHNASHGTAILSAAGHLIQADQALCSMLGYTIDELQGANYADITHPDDGVDFNHFLLSLVNGDVSSYQGECRYVHKDGWTVWALISGVRVEQDQEGPVLLLHIFDVTQEKEADRRRQLITDILQLLSTTDAAADCIRGIMMIIKEYTDMEAVGIRLADNGDYPYYQSLGFDDKFIHDENSLCIYDSKGEITRDEQGYPTLACMCGNVLKGRFDPSLPFFTEGGSFWTNCTSELLPPAGPDGRQTCNNTRCNGEGFESVALIPLRSTEHVVGLLQLNDHRRGRFTLKLIAELEQLGCTIGIALQRKRADEQIELNLQELARSNNDLERFASMVAHDLQEPLRTMEGYAHLLSTRLKSNGDSSLNQFIEGIVGGADHMQAVIDGVLAYCHVNATGNELAIVNTEDILEQALKNLHAAINDSGARITHDPLPTIRCDERQFLALFQNLISNAVKFRDDRAIEIHVSASQSPDESVFSVRDNGLGIEAKDAGRIFERFQRIDSAKRTEGTGIGLATCKRIAENHGGRIWMESRIGCGTTFYVSVPTIEGSNERSAPTCMGETQC